MSLSEDMRRMVDYMLCHVHTSAPGVIETYDADTGLANVQPLITRVRIDDTVIQLPIVHGVPVSFMRTGAASISVKLQRGDTGLLVFCERDISAWVLNGGIQNPAVPLRHDLTNAVFIPGIGPGKPGKPGNNLDIELIANGASVTINEGSVIVKDSGGGQINLTAGKLAVGNSGAELMSVLIEAFTALAAAQTVSTAEPLTSAAVLATVLTQLALIQGALV